MEDNSFVIVMSDSLIYRVMSDSTKYLISQLIPFCATDERIAIRYTVTKDIIKLFLFCYS